MLYAKTSLLHVCTLKWKVFDNLAITFLYLRVRETTNKIIKIVSRYLVSLMNAHITVRTKSLHCMMNYTLHHFQSHDQYISIHWMI